MESMDFRRIRVELDMPIDEAQHLEMSIDGALVRAGALLEDAAGEQHRLVLSKSIRALDNFHTMLSAAINEVLRNG